MARKVVVTIVDDLDGTTADETVVFGIDGVSYEIDLSASNAASLRNALAQWIPHARRIGRSKTRNTSRQDTAIGVPNSRRKDLAAIRTWATRNGHTVSSRGRIAAKIVEAYEKATA